MPVFSETNVISATELMKITALESEMLQDSSIMQKFQDIAEFFMHFEDGLLQARRVVAGRPDDQKLDVLHEYVLAAGQKKDVQEKLLEKQEEVMELQKEFDRLNDITESLLS